MHSRLTIAIAYLGCFAVGGMVFAGTTGNIRGKITDIQTNDALPLVNVLIVGSGRGGVTNDKGEYFVAGVQAGTYTVRASLLGYQVFEAKKVTIDPDETTVLDFKLASTLIEKEGITIEGARPLVDVKKTAGEQTYTKDKIEQLPNVKGVSDVLGLQAGVVKFGQQLFLRGGRSNETQILIDGVVVNDVGGGTSATGGQSTNEQLAQLYSGTSTGGSSGALSVAANAIQSVSVSSSGLDAEYGNAQSGVVNITTKSGSDTYSGSFQYRTDGATSNSLNERYYAGNVGGPEPITHYLLPSLGVEVPGKLSFFASTTFDQSDGAYNFSSETFFHPLKRKVRFSGFFGDLLSGLGFNYDDKLNNDFSFNMKLSYSIGDNDQFAFSYRANTSSAHPLYGWYTYLDRYDSSRSTLSLKTQNVFQWTHILGTNSLIRAYVSRLETDETQSVAGLPPYLYSTPFASTRDPNQDGFFDIGSNQGWSHSNQVIWNAKVALESKVHEYHFLKTGLEYYTEHIQSTAINYPLETPIENAQNPQGDFPLYGRQRFVSNNLPSRGAFWLQDNIELTSLTIRLGLRYDFFYVGKQVSNPAYVKTWFDVVNSGIDPIEEPGKLFYPEWVDNYDPFNSTFKSHSFWNQLTSGFFSPRLAIGYPISERTVFYFNYGHFLQYPDREYYFTQPNTATLSTDAQTVGNPALEPQKTVQYEAGFDQLLTDDVSLGIRGFYKDVFNYIDSRRTNSPNPVSEWVNLDYASVRGFEVILTKGGGGHYSGSLGYTFQLAKGRSSDPRSGLESTQLQGLPREVRMNYDQEHTLNLFAAYRVAADEDYNVFGLNINNWGASVTWNFGSGFPYTPFNFNKGLQDFYLVNSGNGPFSSEIDISIYKGFAFLEKLNLVFTLDVINLLDRRNVDLNAGGFNSFTGQVLRYGDYDPASTPQNIYTWGGLEKSQGFVSRVPPYVFRSPRQISLGMKINWN